MLGFLIYMLIQIILGFSFLAELLASSWNVTFKFLKYTSIWKPFGTVIPQTEDSAAKLGFQPLNLNFSC